MNHTDDISRLAFPEDYNDFIPPFSDFGFKNLFGKGDKSKENLIFLLNEVLKEYPGMNPIVDVVYKNVEQQAENPVRKSSRFDIYCKTDRGETFVVEMQNDRDPLLRNRLVFYLCLAVTEQDSRINPEVPWDYSFPPVIAIMFCNFIDKEIDPCEVNYFGILNRKTFQPFGNHVGLVIVQLPLFPKQENECKTELQRIIYSLENMETIQRTGKIPFSTQKGDFYDRIAWMSRKAALTDEELHAYNQWLKVTNDDRLRELRAEAKGREEGREEGREQGQKSMQLKIARNLLSSGMSPEEVANNTGLSISDLKNL